MKKIIYFSILLLPLFLKAQQIAWTSTINYSNGQTARHMKFDLNGDIFLFGHFYESFNQNGTHGTFLHKYDTAGQLLWMDTTRTWGIPLSGGMAVDAQGNAYVAIGKPSDPNGFGHVYINGVKYPGGNGYMVKYSSAGEVKWIINIGKFCYPKDLSIDKQGNLLVTGHAGQNCFTKRFSTAGAQLSSMNICGLQIGVDGNNNILISDPNQLTKYTPAGVVIWTYSVNAAEFRYTQDESNFIYLVTCDQDGSSEFIKLNGNGSVLWSKNVNFNGCNITRDGNRLYIVQQTLSTKGRSYMEVNEYDLDGNQLNHYRVPNSEDLKGQAILHKGNHTYVSSRHNESLEAYLMRIDPAGFPTAISKELDFSDRFRVYPNPSRVFTLDYRNGEEDGPVSVSIYDVTGRCLVTRYYKFNGEMNEQLDLSSFSKGVYELRLAQRSKSATKRLIVE